MVWTHLYAGFMGQEIPFFSAEGMQSALSGIDFQTTPGVYTMIVKSPTRILDVIPVTILEGNFSDSRLWVEKKFVEFSPEVLERIRDEGIRVRTIFKNNRNQKMFLGDFLRPLQKLFVTAPFGNRRIYNNFLSGRHGGVDLRAWEGTPVRAINNGVVELSSQHYLPGKMIILNHGMGVFSAYLHLSKCLVREGETVLKGQIIAKSGSTGRVTGPHLDLRIRINGARVNPLELPGLKISP